MSPEIVYEQSHNFGVDVWCLGILLYEMLHGAPPFKAESLKEIKKEFKHRKITVSKDYDKDTQSLINLLLQYDSRKRITVAQLLKHPAIVKNLRHFERKLTQEEFNLMRRYYYMNAGGVNLDCHNSVYARQLKRQSQLSRAEEPDSEGFVNLNISQDLGDEAQGLRFPSPENANRGEQRFEKGNDFQPNKFLTPYGKDKDRKDNLNQFQPNNFFAKNEISPLQNHPKIAANAFKRKKNLENKDINQYHPPVFVSKAKLNLNGANPDPKNTDKSNDKRGKSARIINLNKSNHERKNSSLKQKLRNQKLKQAGANINNFNPVSTQAKHTNRERGRTRNPPTSFPAQIGDLRKQNKNKNQKQKQILERKAPPVLNRRRQEITSNRVIRSASSNPALLSHSGTRFGINSKARHQTNKRSKPEPGMTKNKHTKSQTANYWSGGVRRVSRIENKAKPQIANNDPMAAKDRHRENRNHVHHRENSVSVERALNLRVIKTSSSLPKKLFGLKRSQKKNNLNNRKPNLVKKPKEPPRVLNLIKPGANLFNRKFGDKKNTNLRERGRPKQTNYKNHTSINYKADEVIKEEKYLSDFQSIQSSTKKKIAEKLEAKRNKQKQSENKILQLDTLKRVQNKSPKLVNQPKIMSISLQNNSNVSESARSPRVNSKAAFNSRIQTSKASATQVNISVLSKEPSILQIKDNSRIRQVTPSQNSIIMNQNNVSNVSLGASFHNSTKFAIGNLSKKDSKYVSLNDYISTNDLKQNVTPNSLQNNLTQNVLAGLNDPKIQFLETPIEKKIETKIETKIDYNANAKDERKTENLNQQSAEMPRIMTSNPEPNTAQPGEERFSKTTGSANLRIQLQRARAEIEADPNQSGTPGKSLFLNYNFDSRGHHDNGDPLRHSNLEPREHPAKVKMMQSSQSTTTLRTGVQVVRKQAFKNFNKDTSKHTKNNNVNNNHNNSINTINNTNSNNLITKQAPIQDGKLSRIHEENYSMEMASMTKTIEDKHRNKELSILGGVPRGKKQKPEIPAAFRNHKQPEIQKNNNLKQKKFPTPRKSENSRKDSDKRGQHRRNHSMVKRTVIINGVKTERLILSKNHHLYNRNSAQKSDQPSKSPNKKILPNEPASQDQPDINITNAKTGRNHHTKVNSATRYETKTKTGLDGKAAKWVESRQRNIKFGESKSQVRRVLKANRSQKVLRTVTPKEHPGKKRLTLLTTRFGNIINQPEPQTPNQDEPSFTRRYTSNLNALKDTLNAKKRISTIHSTSIGQVMPFQHEFGNTNTNTNQNQNLNLNQNRKKDDINSFISKVQRIESSKEEEVKNEQKKPIVEHKIELNQLQNETRRFANNETHIGVTEYSKLGERSNKSSILPAQKLSLQPEKTLNSNFNLNHSNRVHNSKNYLIANKTGIRKSEVSETSKKSPANSHNQDLSNFQSLRSPHKIKIDNDPSPNLFLNKSNQRVDSHKRQYNAVRFEDSFSFPHWENNHTEQEQSNNESSISILKDLNSIQDTPQSKSTYISRRTTNNSNFYKKENPKPVKSQIVRLKTPNDSILKVEQDVEMVQSNILERQIKKEFVLKQNAETEKKTSERNVQATFAGTRLYQKKNMAMYIKGGVQESGRLNRFTNYKFSQKKGNSGKQISN